MLYLYAVFVYYFVCAMCMHMCNFCFLCFFLYCFPLQLSPSVFWYCWLGLLTCKNRLPYNLYCIGGDVKHCTIQSNPCNRMGWTACFGQLPLLPPSCRKLEFRLSALMDSDLAWVNGESGRQSWVYANAFQRSTVWVKKIPPRGPDIFFIFFTNGWEFVINFLHTY